LPWPPKRYGVDSAASSRARQGSRP